MEEVKHDNIAIGQTVYFTSGTDVRRAIVNGFEQMKNGKWRAILITTRTKEKWSVTTAELYTNREAAIENVKQHWGGNVRVRG